MNISFHNRTSAAVTVGIGGEEHSITPGKTLTVSADEGAVQFCLHPEVKSDVIYAVAKLGIILKRFFVLKGEYRAKISGDMVFTLTEVKRKGRFMDEYTAVSPSSQDASAEAVRYSVWDEPQIRGKIESSMKKGDRAMMLFDVFDILRNAFTGLLILVMPFILIWIFGDIHLAFKVCGYAFIPIFGLIILINRVLDKAKRKLWKKGKGIALRKEIFKDYNSYFDSEYISSVFSDNRKR